MNKKIITILALFIFIAAVFLYFSKSKKVTDGINSVIDNKKENKSEVKNEKKEISKIVSDPILKEAGIMEKSESLKWWLNAGGIFYIKNNGGTTIQGELPSNDFWRELYNKNNPRDTDNGYHPQNIFRLVSRDKWKNLTQEAYFKINKYNLSASSYRNQSNGLLFFNRYQDGDNLYYTGIRVDGFAVIKKKINGKYFTMAYSRIISGNYDRKKNPNLLPAKVWIGIKSEVRTENDGTVSIKIFLDREKNGNWELIANVIDNGKKYGGKAFLDEGYVGIRTDFMDIEFDDYKINGIQA